MSIIKWVDENAEKATASVLLAMIVLLIFLTFLGGRAYPLAVCLVRLVGCQLCVSHRRSRSDYGAT